MHCWDDLGAVRGDSTGAEWAVLETHDTVDPVATPEPRVDVPERDGTQERWAGSAAGSGTEPVRIVTELRAGRDAGGLVA